MVNKFKIGDVVRLNKKGIDEDMYNPEVRKLRGIIIEGCGAVSDAWSVDFEEEPFTSYGVYDRHLKAANITDWKKHIGGKQ